MEHYYSSKEPGTLLHIVFRLADAVGRRNISPESEFLQLACITMSKGQTFLAHKHNPCEKMISITQESWVVIQGSVRCILYDLDDSVLAEPVLSPGDCSITFRGGHDYVILVDHTVVYEYKNGPYLGQASDKTFI